MQRIGFCFKVKKEAIPEYVKRHQEVWPELLRESSGLGTSNYTLFMREDGTVFGYLEAEDWEKATAEMAKSEVNARWQEYMAPLFEGEGRADQNMQMLQEVFHLA